MINLPLNVKISRIRPIEEENFRIGGQLRLSVFQTLTGFGPLVYSLQNYSLQNESGR